MVARVVSQHVVKFDIVDFVGSLRLESLQNDGILLIGDLHAEVVEDRFETCEGNESGMVLVLVLEVWFDQKSSILDVSAETLQTLDQNLLLCVIQHVLRVQNRWCVEGVWSVGWVLFESFIGEDGV